MGLHCIKQRRLVVTDWKSGTSKQFSKEKRLLSTFPKANFVTCRSWPRTRSECGTPIGPGQKLKHWFRTTQLWSVKIVLYFFYNIRINISLKNNNLRTSPCIFLTVLLHSIHSDLAWQPCHWGRRERGEKQDVYSLSLLQQEQEQWCLHISDHSILSSGPPPGAGPLTHSPGLFEFASTKQWGASEGQLLWLAWFDADVFLGEKCHWRRTRANCSRKVCEFDSGSWER